MSYNANTQCPLNAFADINYHNGSPGFYHTYKLLNKIALEDDSNTEIINLLSDLNEEISKIASEFLLMQQR